MSKRARAPYWMATGFRYGLIVALDPPQVANMTKREIVTYMRQVSGGPMDALVLIDGRGRMAMELL